MGAQVGDSGKAREIVATREVDAPRELIWQAFADPEQVVHWWGPQTLARLAGHLARDPASRKGAP